MVHEIYTTLPTDLNYIFLLETDDDIVYILQQIRMVLGTKPGEVLGNPTFGLNLEQYLFNLSYDKTQIQKNVQDAILTNVHYDSTKYTVAVDVKFGKEHDSSSDYALIDITVNERKCLGIVVTQ